MVGKLPWRERKRLEEAEKKQAESQAIWNKFIDDTISAHQAQKQKHLDDVLDQPFDWKAHSTKVEKGTRVGYSRRFLKSIGCGPTDPMWFAQGTVQRIVDLGGLQIASIKWHVKGWEQTLPSRVNVKNLAPVGPNLKWCGD